MRMQKMGDKFPDSKNPKWGGMKAGRTHWSEEWHDMSPSEEKFSDKWDDMNPSKARMSEKWVDQDSTGDEGEWSVMKQSERENPYTMNPSKVDREQGFVKQSKNPMKNEGHGRYDIHGTEGQSGKGL